MALPIYLAMTAFELQHCQQIPKYCSWMACHFSAYSSGLTNIPASLPENALLMVNDRIPPMGHSEKMILHQLQDAVEKLHVYGVLLDFQLPYREDLAHLGNALLSTLPCPVGITPQYANAWNGPVFLPPIPPYCAAADHLASWNGREIWLESDNCCFDLTVSETGCRILPANEQAEHLMFSNTELFCHYKISLADHSATFTLGRTGEDAALLMEAAEKLGVTLAVGLYQQVNC